MGRGDGKFLLEMGWNPGMGGRFSNDEVWEIIEVSLHGWLD